MDAGLAQRMALVAYGNAFLSGLLDEPPDLLTGNSVFQHVRSVEFRSNGTLTRRVARWFSALSTRGVERLWVRDADLVAEGDGVREAWLPSSVFISRQFEERQQRQIRELFETGSWNEKEARAVSALADATERPWRLCFDREPSRSPLERGPTLPDARDRLIEAVTAAQELSRQHRLGYVRAFGTSLSLLRSRSPVAPYHPDVLPQVGYSVEARRVLAAAAEAWVFGPWGWGDRLFSSEAVAADFQRVDSALRDAVWTALVAAANAFDGTSSS